MNTVALEGDQKEENVDIFLVEENENELENKCGKSFFSQLKKFCTSLQSQYQDIKSQFELPPGSNPRHYDRGLKSLKSEVSNLKKVVEENRENINKIQQFGYFVESSKDLVNAQKEDLQRMEMFLMRYGYVPPKEVETVYDLPEDKKESEEIVEDKPLKSPELSEIGKKIIEGKPLPILTKPRIIMEEPLVVNREKVITTPLQQNNSKWYMTPTPGESSRKKIEKWIMGIEATASSMTPMCAKSVKNTLLFEDEEESYEPLKHTDQSEYHTPDEPIIPSVKNILKGNTSATPEDPVISSIDYSYIKRQNQFQDTTPEEPVLMAQSKKQNLFQDSTPEEPILMSQPKKKNLQDTPEEPVLLSQSKKQKGREKMNMNSHSAPFESVSPQLSDITQKILNLRQIRDAKNDINLNVASDSTSKLDTALQNLEPESPKLSDVTLKLIHKNSKTFQH